MPLECPNGFAQYNACLSCGYRHENECWTSKPFRALRDILTIEDRICLLEDRKEVPEVNIVTMTHKDYQQLQRLLLSLQEKLYNHLAQQSTTKRRSKYT